MLKHKSLFYFFFYACIFLFTVIYSLYFNKLHWGDEYDNFVYSWLVAGGLTPYRDFFTHHFPFLIFLGVPLEFLSHSKLVFRYFVFFTYISFFSFSAFYLKGPLRWSIPVFLVISSFGISLFGGQQFVDGTFWAVLLLSGFFIVVQKQGEILTTQEIILFSALVIFTAFSSPPHLLGFLMLITYHLFLQKKKSIPLKNNLNNLKILTAAFAASVAFFLVYLIITNSFKDFVYDTFVFNSQIYFYRSAHDVTGIKFVDYYYWTTREFLVHIYLLAKNEGSALITFVKASKHLLLPFGTGNYSSYASVVFGDFYNNFFSFEMFILLFYIFGVFSLIFSGRPSLAFFCLVFILGIRVRLYDRDHMNPYYLLSYWLLAVSISSTFTSVYKNRVKKLIARLLLLFIIIPTIALFIQKNLPDFKNATTNNIQTPNQTTIEFIKNNTNPNNKILVVSGDLQSAYYFDSLRKPFGPFVSYFSYTHQSEKLRTVWLDNLNNFNGYLILSSNTFNQYCNGGNSLDPATTESLDSITRQYRLIKENEYDLILERAKDNEKTITCPV